MLALISGGDEAAFTELFEHYRHKVFFIAWKVLKSDAAAEDVLQEIFVAVWKERRQLTGLGNFNSWLNTLIRNHLANRLRKQSSEIIYFKDTLYRREGETQNLLEAVEWNELHRLLLKALEQLPAQQRRVFELARMEGLKLEEIAALMNLSRNTVKNHLAAAQKNIRDHFERGGHPLTLLAILVLTFR